MNKRKSRPVYFPKIVVTNLTNQPLYIGVKSRESSGVYLAPSGSDGDEITLEGIDWSDIRIVRTLGNLYTNGKISIALAESLTASLLKVPGVTTSTTTTSTSTTTTASP